MSIRFERVAKILIPDEDEKFSWWANYLWDNQKNMWRCTEANSGFHKKHGIGWELTDYEMLAMTLRYS